MSNNATRTFSLTARRLLPRSLRFALIRKRLVLPDHPGELVFKPADSTDEFFQVFRILHDCYVEYGYMQPSQSRMRITAYHLIPQTTTFVAKVGDLVVGAISVVRDNPLGLPMDKTFDLSPFRDAGERISEISGLAIRSEFRGNRGRILHSLIRYMWKFSCAYLGVDRFLAAVNPSMNELYESVYLFDRLSRGSVVANYDFANGAPAVGLVSPPLSAAFSLWKAVYGTRDQNKNLHAFIAEDFVPGEHTSLLPPYFAIPESRLPESTRRAILRDPLLNPMTKLGLADQIKALVSLCHPNIISINFEQNTLVRQSARRHNVDCMVLGDSSRISNVSETGFKAIHLSQTRAVAKRLPITIQLGPAKLATVYAEMVWCHKANSGYRVIDADAEWHDFIEFLDCREGGKDSEEMTLAVA